MTLGASLVGQMVASSVGHKVDKWVGWKFGESDEKMTASIGELWADSL